MTAGPSFAHVVYRTSQMTAMRDWYCVLLDAHVVYEGHGLAFLTYDSEHHRVALMESAEPLQRKSPHAAWTHHVAYTFPDLASLLDRYVKLKAKGVEPAMPIQHGVTTSLYYEDPDGNLAEMQIDNFATAGEATSYMQGSEYDADPRGPWFSPDAMMADFRAGRPVAELTTRAWAAAHPLGAVQALQRGFQQWASTTARRSLSQAAVAGSGSPPRSSSRPRAPGL